MSAWQVYWLLQLDEIQSLFQIVSVVFIIASVIWAIFGSLECFVSEDMEKKTYFKVWKWICIVTIPMYLLASMIPSSKTMAAIYVLPKLIKGDTIETVGKDAGDIYKLGVDRLKEILKDSPQKDSK